jgi:hypothetical protein
VKVAAFTVRSNELQSARWKQCAAADGHASVGAWLAVVADAYMRTRARAGLPLPLSWHRARFSVLLVDGREVEVKGMASPPFGYFEGTQEGPADTHYYRLTLAHLPTRKVIATLRTVRACRALASELAPALMRENRELAAGVVERHQREQV